MVLKHYTNAGGSLAVDVSGTGPLVICGPAMGDRRDTFNPLANLLSNSGYTCAVIDVRGHGDSSASFSSYGDEATADDYLFLIDTLGAGQSAVLVGASFSAAAATIAAGRRPDLVRGLVLLGPFLRAPMGAAGNVLMKALVAWPWGPSVWGYYSKTLWPGLGAEGAAKRAEELVAELTRPERWAAFQATVAGADHRVVAPWLPKARSVPTVVIMGEKDPDWTKPIVEAEWVASNFETAKVVAVPGVGHAPQLESPEVVGKTVVEFLTSLEA